MPENRNKTDQQKAGPSTPSSEPQRKSLGEIDKAEKAALQHGLGVLKKFSPKKKPGFAKLPEKSEGEKTLENMSSQEKMGLLRKILEAKPETPQQRFLSQKLSVLQNIVQRLTTKTSLEVSEMLGNFNVRKKLYEKYRDRFRNPKLPQPSEEARFLNEEFDKLKKWFEENAQELAMRILVEPHFSIEQTLPAEIREIIEAYGISLKEIKTEKDVYDYYARYILELRKKKDYETATNLAEGLLASEFAQAQQSFQKENPEAWQKELEATKSEILLNGKTVQLYRELKDQWKAQGMTEDQINEYYGAMQRMELARGVRKFFAKHYLDGKIAIPESKSSVWAQYRYMLDPKDETFLLADESWDEIASELMINAPLIIVSGGFAALGRGAIASGALELSGATTRFLASRGVEHSARRYLTGSLVSQAIKTTAKAGVNLALEGAIFDATHRALTFQQYESLSGWAKSAFWSAITLGAFHGSGRLAERAFAKQTALGAAIAKIKNPHVQEAAKTLLLKGHVEAATMLLTGAIQNAEYSGSLDQFFHDFGDELLHAYVTVGALKVSGVAVKSITQKRTPAPIDQGAKIEPEIPEREQRTVEVSDERLRFAFSNDGTDIELFSGMGSMTSRQLTVEIRKILAERGITQLKEGEPIFLEFGADDPHIPSEMRAILERADKVGVYIFGSLKSKEGGKFRGKTVSSIVPIALPVCEINKQMYRVLRMPEWSRDKDTTDLQGRINSIFVPSQIIEINGQRYMLMPFIKNIEHPTTISRAEYDDFIARLEKSGINFLGDIDGIEEGKAITPDDNLVRLNGKLFLCDPGDAISGGLAKDTPSNLPVVKSRLKTRIKPNKNHDL